LNYLFLDSRWRLRQQLLLRASETVAVVKDAAADCVAADFYNTIFNWFVNSGKNLRQKLKAFTVVGIFCVWLPEQAVSGNDWSSS
jgi:hypothetical protein